MPFGVAVGSVARIAGHEDVGVRASAGRNDLHDIGEGSAIGSSQLESNQRSEGVTICPCASVVPAIGQA
jgi:hypothetical protein